MSNETRRVIRDALGAIEDAFRQQRAENREILKRLDKLIEMAGGTDAKVQAIREDHDALADKVNNHGKRLASLAR